MQSKVLVFAHTPPPLHGQSYMVELMIQGLGGDWRTGSGQKKTDLQVGDETSVQCFHVNARVSDDLEDVGGMRFGKLVRLAKFCLEAIGCRLRHGVDALYYVPAPAKRSAILRDWMVMLCVRPWFRRTIFHWHAFGLGEWASKSGVLQSLTRCLLKNADCSIVLTEFNKADAAVFSPKQLVVIPNGIPDPAPAFISKILPEREKRLREREEKKQGLRVLFLAHCTREKGLFDTLEAIRLANLQCHQASESPISLTVAGDFMDSKEKTGFEQRVAEIHQELGGEIVRYAGFLRGREKTEAFASHDVLCFPTFYGGETFGVTILEALAFGLPVVTTKWRGIPEILPPNWPYLVECHDVETLARSLREVGGFGEFQCLRNLFLDQYAVEPYLQNLRQVLAPSLRT